MKTIKITKSGVKRMLAVYENIYIYGAGKEAGKILKLLGNMNISVKAMLVSDANNNADKVGDIIVMPFDRIEAFEKKHAAFVIGVSQKYFDEIELILKEAGVENIFVICHELWEQHRNRPKLEITAKIGCSINCKHCPQNKLLTKYFEFDQKRKNIMEFEDYKKALSHMPKNTVISFAGFVEPFFHPQGIDMIIYAHQNGFDVELFTTFMGISYEDYLKIKNIPFKQVVLHTPDIKEYANIKISDEYKKIIDDALDSKREDGLPFIDSANCQSMPSDEFLEIAAGRIMVESDLIDRAGNLESEELRSSNYKKGPIYCNRTEKLNHWVLLPDGTVVLCCMDFGLKHPLGNLFESTYEDITDGDVYIELRKGMGLEMNDSLCRNCSSSRLIESSRNL